MLIEWELEPSFDLVEGGRVQKRLWQTACQRLRLSHVTRQGNDRYAAEVLGDSGYVQCENNALGTGYVRYYNSLREAAEAAERSIDDGTKVLTNREDLLVVAAYWPEPPPSPEEPKEPMPEEERRRLMKTRNQTYKVKEEAARRLMKVIGADQRAKGTLERLETHLNHLARWANTVTVELKGEDKRLFRSISEALQEGEVIEVVPTKVEEEEDVTGAREDSSGDSDTPDVGVQSTDAELGGHAEAVQRQETGPAAADGPPWRIVKERLVSLTPELVERFTKMEAFPRDRKVKKPILIGLRAAFEEGYYRGGEFASVKVLETKKTYRVNGKHTGMVCAEWLKAGNTLPDVKMTVKEYECDTMAQAVELYRTFDPAFSGRSKGDMIRCSANADQVLAKLSDATIKLVTPAIAYATWGDQYKKHGTIEQTDLMLENAGFVVWFNDLLGKKAEGKHLWRAPVVAAMYRTWQTDSDAAVEFWEGVKNGAEDEDAEEKDENLPENQLKAWLESHKFGASSKDGKLKGTTDREGLWHCLNAWNAFREQGEYPPEDDYDYNSAIPEAV